MKPSALRIERLLAKVEARLAPPPRKWLRVIIHDGDDEAEAMEQALAEHIATHPEDAGRTVDDFDWIVNIVDWKSFYLCICLFQKWGENGYFRICASLDAGPGPGRPDRR